MEARRRRALKALAKVEQNPKLTPTARAVWRAIRAPYRGDIRGVAQTLRRAVDDGLVEKAGKPGDLTYRLTKFGRREAL